tara:strand:- start:499 stop:1092 length:594 start_codon:yes stop_codon:yes gene_type:complete
MSKTNRTVEKKDIISAEVYAKNRKEFRKRIIEFKKNRRLSVGPYATFYFECFETMLAQIQEMLHIEKGGEAQLKDELAAYNSLIPKGNELIATLMFEIDNPISRADFLGKIGGIEKNVYIEIDNQKIQATSETDVDRTSEDGKASSVQFLHFTFSEEQIKKFKNFNVQVLLGIDHKYYEHMTKISENIRSNLIKDFA